MDISKAEKQRSYFWTCLSLCEPFNTDQKVHILNLSAAWESHSYVRESVSPFYILLQLGQYLMGHPIALLMLHAHCAENSWWANLEMHVEGTTELESGGCWARHTWQHIMTSIGPTLQTSVVAIWSYVAISHLRKDTWIHDVCVYIASISGK